MQSAVSPGGESRIEEVSDGTTCDVALISMPFGILEEPAIALGLLKASLKGPSCEVLYFTLRFAEKVEPDLYNWIASGSRPLSKFLGEHLFRSAAFPEHDWDDDEFWNRWIDETENVWIPKPLDLHQQLQEIRAWVAPFLDECVEEVLRLKPRIVGFTSVFQQQLASLALARRLKKELPDTFIVFGGANCEGPMGREMIQQFNFLDAVVSGEGEIIFPQLVERVLDGQAFDDLAGVSCQANLDASSSQPPNAPRVAVMDDLPIPDYSDFFTAWHDTSYAGERQPRLPYETSRGCWWGEKKHCTFCGLNGASMTFRSKTGERALFELRALLDSYPVARVQAVDNILDMRYFDDFIPALADEDWKVRLFYEVKANLTKEHLRKLLAAGITEVQPGIESLSTHVLQAMGKGVTMLQNVRLLKWCQEVGIQPIWNVLWGFPEERPSDYEEISRLTPWLSHLAPPIYAGQLRLDRFSPNFERSEALGFVEVRPDAGYSQLYPLKESSLSNLAYYFDYEYRDDRDVTRYTETAREAIIEWRRVHEPGSLVYLAKQESLLVLDRRPAAKSPFHLLSGLDRSLFEACDDIRSKKHLVRLAGQQAAQEVESRLASLVEAGLIIHESGAYLSLAVRREFNSAE